MKIGKGGGVRSGYLLSNGLFGATIVIIAHILENDTNQSMYNPIAVGLWKMSTPHSQSGQTRMPSFPLSSYMPPVHPLRNKEFQSQKLDPSL